jgi:DNA-damage-inducible protein J
MRYEMLDKLNHGYIMTLREVICMAQVNIRIDDALKEDGEKLFKALGMNFSTAISIFISQAVRVGGLPFAVTTRSDMFFNESNMKVLRASIADMDAGRGIVRKTMEELEAMEDEQTH